MVTMAVFAIVAGAAVSLFQFQSKSSAGANVRKIAGEAVTLALLTIQRDVERAGMGLMNQPKLSLLVTNGGTGKPDELYVSFSEHVSMSLGRDKNYSFFDAGSELGKDKLWFTLSGGSTLVKSDGTTPALTDVGAWIGTDGAAPPIGALIRQSGASKPVADILKSFSATQSAAQKKKNQCTITLTLSGGVSGNAAPAISYKLIASASDQTAYPSGSKPQLGTLMRNGIPLAGGGVPLIGAWEGEKTPFIKVTDFQIRCGFFKTGCDFTQYYTDRTKTQCWSPDNGSALGDLGWEIDKLRAIEVTIRYIVKDKGGGAKYPDPDEPYGMKVAGFGIADDKTYGPWALGGDQTITIAPRNVVLGQYLGPPK